MVTSRNIGNMKLLVVLLSPMICRIYNIYIYIYIYIYCVATYPLSRMRLLCIYNYTRIYIYIYILTATDKQVGISWFKSSACAMRREVGKCGDGGGWAGGAG